MPDQGNVATAGPVLFYDGDCGLCHGAVKFVLARDKAGVFRFAPLDSDAFERLIPAAERTNLPDSMILRTAEAQTLTESDAVVEMLRGIGGAWRLPASLLALLPRRVRNGGYRFVAGVRRRIFAAPSGVCPVLPADLRSRFLLD